MCWIESGVFIGGSMGGMRFGVSDRIGNLVFSVETIELRQSRWDTLDFEQALLVVWNLIPN